MKLELLFDRIPHSKIQALFKCPLKDLIFKGLNSNVFLFCYIYIYCNTEKVNLYIQEDFLLESSVFVFVFVFACVFVIVITGASLDSTRRELSESVFYVGL